MTENRKRPKRRLALIVSGGLLGLCLLILAATAVINQTMPTHSAVLDQLSAAEKARVTEFFHLRQTVGDAVWPGWGQADNPVVVYNEATAFLIGYPDPPDGWLTVPDGSAQGGPWRLTPDEMPDGTPYYRQPLPASGETPQAFTVQIGPRWAASLTTYEWMQIELPNQLRQDLPPGIRQVFPYFLVSRVFVDSSDWYISLIAHEAFHAYQGTIAPERVTAAEMALRQAGRAYPWENEGLQTAWQEELDLLITAVRTEDAAATAVLAQQFLAQRQQRRQNANLSPAEIDYERQREWLEGLAKYAELDIWRQAANTAVYQPAAALSADPDFKQYTTFSDRWQQEIAQIGRTGEEDGRFYYTGLAQAVLLDRLWPEWKAQALDQDAFLEDLLNQAIK